MRINLTKKDIINSIYMQIGFSKKVIENLLEDLLSIINNHINDTCLSIIEKTSCTYMDLITIGRNMMKQFDERLSNYNYKLISQSKGKLKEIYEFEQMLLKQYQQRKIDKDFDHYLDGITEFLDLLDFEVNEIKSRIEDF